MLAFACLPGLLAAFCGYNESYMQLLQAGRHRLLLLEYDPDALVQVCNQAGFQVSVQDGARAMVLDLTAVERQIPLLLFDAADSANAGWFSRCQFYVDGASGNVLQTPITLANKKDRAGGIYTESLWLSLAKELTPGFRLPGRQAVSEQVIYGLLFNLLAAMHNVGVAVCGSGVFEPLHKRREPMPARG